MKLFLPVFFLLSLSFVSAFGDTGSIIIVSGKSFQINYDANYVQVSSAQANTQDQGLIFSIQVTNPTSTLELTLPRDLIDATKKDGTDDSFIVLADGAFTQYVEKNSDKTSRTILIQLAPENKELEIIGTSLASSSGGSTGLTQTPSPVQTPINPQQPNPSPKQPVTQSQQNQTSTPVQKPTENTSQQNQSVHESLSKIFHSIFPNLPSNMNYKQIIEYSVIASAILILVLVIASLKKSKTKKQIRK